MPCSYKLSFVGTKPSVFRRGENARCGGAQIYLAYIMNINNYQYLFFIKDIKNINNENNAPIM